MDTPAKIAFKHSFIGVVGVCFALAGIAWGRAEPFDVSDLAIAGSVLTAATVLAAREAYEAGRRHGGAAAGAARRSPAPARPAAQRKQPPSESA